MQVNNYNQDEVKEKGDFSPLPENKYVCILTESTETLNSAGTGSFAKCVFQVVHGEFNDRKIWLNLNLNNPNTQAVEIARSELKSMQVACNKPKILDTSELHNIPMILTVALKKDKENVMRNVINKYEEASKDNMPQDQAPPASAAPATSGPGDKPDWMK